MTEIVEGAAPQAPDASATNTQDDAATRVDATQPSGEDGGKGEPQPPKTALEAAKRVMAAAPGKEEATTSEKPQDGKQAKPEGEKDAPADADDKLPAQVKNDPRFKELKSENRILKVAKEKNEEAIAALEPKAQNYDNLSTWLQQQQLSTQDFQSMLSIGAALKNDPAKAYELLRPVFEQLEGLVGVRLPQDLQAEVDAGHISIERARELVRTKTEQAYLQQRERRMAQETQAERERREQEDRDAETKAVVEGVGAHLKSWEARDPDAAKKRQMVMDQVELEFHRLDKQRTSPWTLGEATQVVDDVIARVNKHFRSFTPAPQPRSGPLPPGAPAIAGAAPVPQSSLDAARGALAATRTG